MFELKYTLTEEDYYEYNEYWTLNSSSGKAQINSVRFSMVFICVAFLLIFLIIDVNPYILITEIIILSILAILAIIFAKQIYMQQLRSNFKRLKKAGKLIITGDVVFNLKDDYFTETTTQSVSKYKYSIIEQIADSKQAVYLHITVTQAMIIPARAFTDEAQKKAFIEFIESKIKESKNILPQASV